MKTQTQDVRLSVRMESKGCVLWDLVVEGIPDGIRVNVWLLHLCWDEIRARILEKSKLTGKECITILSLQEQSVSSVSKFRIRSIEIYPPLKLKSTFNTKAGQPVRLFEREARILIISNFHVSITSEEYNSHSLTHTARKSKKNRHSNTNSIMTKTLTPTLEHRFFGVFCLRMLFMTRCWDTVSP